MIAEESAKINGVWFTDVIRHSDGRGFFSEIFRKMWFTQPNYVDWRVMQANHSFSKPGVLRGLHYHEKQIDFWYVASGVIQVGLVDLKENSRTYQNTQILQLNSGMALYIPQMVAHGFLAQTEVNLIYFVNQYYDGDDEHNAAWDGYGLDWDLHGFPSNYPIISARDEIK